MGNVALCCGAGSFEMTQRQELLKEGNDFKKKTSYLGGVLSKSESIYLQLNPTATRCVALEKEFAWRPAHMPPSSS